MELSEFTFRIILLFIPGLISFIVIDELTIHKESKIYKILMDSLVLGFLCYLSYNVLIVLINYVFKSGYECVFFKTLIDKKLSPNLAEIACVTGLSVPVGLLGSFFANHKVLHRIAHKLKISKKFGDIDVWSYIMNSQSPEWVVIRDVGNDLMYEGWVEAFSDGTDDNELFLRDVKVLTSSTAKELYEIPGLYLPRKREDLIIEFPLLEFGEYRGRPINREGKHNA